MLRALPPLSACLLLAAGCLSERGAVVEAVVADTVADDRPSAPSSDAGGPRDTAPLPPPLSAVVLNEVQCKGDEWVELHNPADEEADVSRWRLADDADDPRRAWALPRGSVVPAGGFLVVAQETTGAEGYPFGVACGQETVTLLRTDHSVADAVAAGEGTDTLTWGRLPDGSGDWTPTEPTPGEPNRAPVTDGGDLFDPAGVHTIDLRLEGWAEDDLRRDPYRWVAGRLRFSPADGEPGEWLDVGLRLKGRAGSLRDLDDKPAFKVDLNREVSGQTLLGVTKLTLNNMVQDPSMLHEWLAYLLLRENGVPAPRLGYAWVTLNGRDYGLYANVETMDAAWLDRHFESTAHLYEGLYGQDLHPEAVKEMEVDVGDPDDRRDLKRIVEAVHHHLGFYRATTELVDWDEVLAMMATELYIGHWDGYAATRNNYFFHLDEAGRLSLLPWGTDQTFQEMLHLHRGGGLLLRTCLETWECRERYDRALEALVSRLDEADPVRRLEEHAQRLAPWVKQDPRKPYPFEHSEEVVRETRRFLERRREEVGDLLRCLFDPEGGDPDGDGFSCDEDCDNGDPDTHPHARDLCGDGRDQDCNGRPDDGPDCPDCTEVSDRRGHRYLVCTTPRTWRASREHCREEGAALEHDGEPPVFDLAVFDDRDEAYWLTRQAMEVWPQDYWIGLSDREREGRFVWVDGRPLREEQALWGEQEPNDWGEEGGEDCVQIWGHGARWNDLPCEAELGALCEEVAGDDRP